MPATESVNSGGTGGYDSITSSRLELPPLSSYIDSLNSPAGVFQQSQPGLLGGLVYRNRLFTDDLIHSFTERCRYTDLGEMTAVIFEGVKVLQAGQVSTYTFTSQALAEYRCVVITSMLTGVEAMPISPTTAQTNMNNLNTSNGNAGSTAPNVNLHPNNPHPRSIPIPSQIHQGVRRRTRTGPPEFAQTHKKSTPRVTPRKFLSTEEIESNPYYKSGAERAAQVKHYEDFETVEWGKHFLGPMTRWGVVLKSEVEKVLASPQPTLLIWGPQWTAIL